MKSIKIQEDYLKFRRAAESSGEAIFITDPTGIITYINPEFTKIYGFDREEIVGKVTPRILKSGVMNQESYEYMWNEILNKRVVKGEYVNKMKNGKYVIIEGSANAIINDKDEIVGFLAVQRDITERKQIEDTLRESEEKFRSLIEELPIAIIIFIKKKIVYVNNECLRLLRLNSKSEILGRPPLDLVYPGSISMVKKWMQKSLRSKSPLSGLEQTHIRPDGSLITVEMTASRTIYEKQPAVRILLQDITERKSAEQALKEAIQFNSQIIQSAREGIIVYDRNLRFHVWNQFMENLTGLKASDVIGKNSDDLLYLQNDSRVLEHVNNALNGETTFGIEYEFSIGKTARSGWVSEATAPLIDLSGCVRGVIRTVHDITKRKQTEIEYLHAKNRAEENDRLKTAFLCNMSHEIRTPMNGIYGFSQLLIKSDLSENKRQLYSESITNCCEQLLDTVNNILDISKIEKGQIETDIEIIDVNSLMRDIFNLHNIKLSGKNINLVMSLDLKDENCLLYTDKCKLQQIINNLIDNALKFTQKGYVKYGYKVVKNRVQFYVEDTGIGIPEDCHDLIFERFRQVESSLSRNYGGVGLGLAICKDLVHLLGGKIWVSSCFSKGSTFTFTIPYIPASKNNYKESIDDIKRLHERLNIMIVEDSYLNYLFIREILTTANYSYIHASNGKEAVEICQSDQSIDLILMDIKMPLMDGYETLSHIRNIRPGIPVIAQSAYALNGENERALKAGFNGFLSKPIMKNELIKTIQRSIEL